MGGDVRVLLADGLAEHVDLDLRAASAIPLGGVAMLPASASALSRQTVKAPEEPSPVPAGMSATEAISSGAPRQWRQHLAQDRVADLARVVDLLELERT